MEGCALILCVLGVSQILVLWDNQHRVAPLMIIAAAAEEKMVYINKQVVEQDRRIATTATEEGWLKSAYAAALRLLGRRDKEVALTT
eukprot:COSAG01_NODE_603_length_14905_cov_12.534648_2_plen_87_part_00